MSEEFEKRGVKMIGLSADDLGSHGKWIEDINEISKTNLKFPIIGDKDREVSLQERPGFKSMRCRSQGGWLRMLVSKYRSDVENMMG